MARDRAKEKIQAQRKAKQERKVAKVEQRHQRATASGDRKKHHDQGQGRYKIVTLFKSFIVIYKLMVAKLKQTSASSIQIRTHLGIRVFSKSLLTRIRRRRLFVSS